jgi:hypothetical protein
MLASSRAVEIQASELFGRRFAISHGRQFLYAVHEVDVPALQRNRDSSNDGVERTLISFAEFVVDLQ